MEALPAWVMGDDFFLTRNHTVKHYLKCLTKDEFVTYKDTSMTVCIFVTRVFVNKSPISCSEWIPKSFGKKLGIYSIYKCINEKTEKNRRGLSRTSKPVWISHESRPTSLLTASFSSLRRQTMFVSLSLNPNRQAPKPPIPEIPKPATLQAAHGGGVLTAGVDTAGCSTCPSDCRLLLTAPAFRNFLLLGCYYYLLLIRE
jgi:hypothetical protein